MASQRPAVRACWCVAATVLATLAPVPGSSQDGADPGPGGEGERVVYEFARALSDKEPEGAYAPIALEELQRYDRLHPAGRYSDDVHYRMAREELERDRPGAAAARFLEVLIVDRGAPREAAAREELDRLLEGKALRPLRPRFREAIERYGPERGARDDGRLRFLRALLLVDDRDAADVTLGEAALYLERVPVPPSADEVALAAGDVERRRGEPRRAIAAYERVASLTPSSPLVARAALEVAEVLEADLDDALGAVAACQRVARDLPDSPEAASAWLRMGRLERKELRRPEIALRDFDEVLTRYPEHPDALEAVIAKAETLSVAFREHEKAERVLRQGAETYAAHARAPELLEAAARIAEHDRKDPLAAAAHGEALGMRYPAYARAPEALYHAAELLEKAGETARAASLYREVGERFPGSKLAERARKRAARLEP